MAKSTLNREDQIDEQYANRFNHPENSPEARLSSDEATKLRDIEQNYGKDGVEPPARGDKPQSTTDAARQAEQQGGNSWTNQFTGKNSGTNKFKALKKKGPLGFIVALLLGGGAGFSFILAPGIGIVHLKEVMTDDLNDQLTAMTVRQDAVLRAKLRNIQGTGFCSSTVTIRCKFSTMSNREIRRFEKAGFEVDRAPTRLPTGRQKIATITSPSGEVFNNPAAIINSNDPGLRSALNQAFNPKFIGFTDAIANKVFNGFRTDKTRKIKGSTDAERDKSFNEASSGEKFSAVAGRRTIYTDGNGGRYVLDDNGARIPESDTARFNEVLNKSTNSNVSQRAGSVEPGKSAAGSVLTSGAKGLSVTGAADTACTVYNTARAVAAAAKVARSAQLARFAMVFLVTADRIKAGEAKVEEVSYIGDNLTATDQQERVSNETTIRAGLDTSGDKDNPFYGKAAFDSPGYKVAAYNDAPTLTTRSQQFMVGGGLVGTLSRITDDLVNVIPGADNKAELRSACGKIQSWWARGAGLIGGIIVGIGSFGAVTALTIGASVAIGFALPFLTAALADILAGSVVSSSTDGVDSGNAIFAGSAAIMGEMAQSRGMKPATKEELQSYMAVSQRVKNELIAIKTYNARDEPLNVYNQYSFLGSLSRSVLPFSQQIKTEPVAAILSAPGIVLNGVKQFSPLASASSGSFNPERFTKCQDEGYAELGIDADVFCNVRYVLTNTELRMDTIQNVQWMIDNEHINENGDAQSEAYKDWRTNCVEREDGWGESSSEDQVSDADIGKTCMETGGAISHFRVYEMDKGVLAGLENDPVAGGAGQAEESSTTAGSLPSGTAQELARQVIASDNVTGDSRYMAQIQAVADGNDSCHVNPDVLGIIVATMDTYRLYISSLNRRCTGVLTASGTGSYHYREAGGHAIDIAMVNGVSSTGATSQDIRFLNDVVKILPQGSGIGQSNCRSGGQLSLPTGITQFNDSCNHNHIQVPIK